MPSSPEEMQVLSLIDNNDSEALVLPDPLSISVNPKNVLSTSTSTTNPIMDGLDHHHYPHHHHHPVSSIPSTPPPLPLSQNNDNTIASITPLANRDLLPVSPAFNSNPDPTKTSSLAGPRPGSLASATCSSAITSTTATSSPPRPHRAMPSSSSNNDGSIRTHLSVPIDSTRRSSPGASDLELGSAPEDVYNVVTGDAVDAPVVNVNEIEGACGCPNANSAGGNPKRQRGPSLSPDERCDRGGFRVRKNQSDDSHSHTMHPRPVKRARIDDSNIGVYEGGIPGLRIRESRDGVGEEAKAPRNRRKDNEEIPPRTRTPVRERGRESEADRENSLVGTPPRMSVSPSRSPSRSLHLSRPPPPTRFQSSSSCSTLTSGSPFPKTPPPSSNHTNACGTGVGSPPPATSCSFSPGNGLASVSGPQQFWFEDGDLVLLVNPPSPPPVSPNYAQSTDPFTPATYLTYVSEALHVHQEATPAGPVPFRIHASRLALASKAFTSLLTTKLRDNPSKEDSARAAIEIAARLNKCRRNRLACEPFYHTTGDPFEKYQGVRDVEYEYEVVGGCPAVRLEGDSPKDWLVTLEAIYEPLSFQVRPIVFDALARALRMSTRYSVHTLREWALTQLRTTWPAQVERMSPIALPHAADAIALARSCDVPDILPAAFYALAIQRWRPAPVHAPSRNSVSARVALNQSPMSGTKASGFVPSHMAGFFPSPTKSPSRATGIAADLELGGTDGGRAHTVLDPVDLRRLVMGRETLQDVLVEIVANPLVVGTSMWEEDSCEFGARAEQSKNEMHPAVVGLYPSPPSPSPSPGIRSSATGNGNGNTASGEVNANTLMSGTPSPALSNSSGASETTLVPAGMTYNRPTPQSLPSYSSLTPSSSSNSYFPGFLASQPTPTSAPDSSCSTMTTTMPRPNFSFCATSAGTCRTTLESLWRTRLAPDGRRPWGTWLARELYRLATLPRGIEPGAGQEFTFDNGCTSGKADCISASACGGADGSLPNPNPNPNVSENLNKEEKGKANSMRVGMANEVCASCWEENRRLALWRLDWLCAAIPKIFML